MVSIYIDATGEWRMTGTFACNIAVRTHIFTLMVNRPVSSCVVAEVKWDGYVMANMHHPGTGT